MVSRACHGLWLWVSPLTLTFLGFNFLFLLIGVNGCVCVRESECSQRPEEVSNSLEPGISELPEVDAGK